MFRTVEDAVHNQRNQMGLADASWPDDQHKMLVAGQRALANSLHEVISQRVPLHQHRFQDFG